jgi:hypothetical protein
MEAAYRTLEERIQCGEAEAGMTTVALVDRLRKDTTIDWATIEANERTKPTWSSKKWYWYAVRPLLTPGRFRRGGDRVSAEHAAAADWQRRHAGKARGQRQATIVALADERAQVAAPIADADEPEPMNRVPVEDKAAHAPRRWCTSGTVCPVLVTPSPSNPTVCGVCHDLRVAGARPTFSDATVKRNHRGWCALESMAHPRVLSAALLVFDAPLPIGGDGRTTYCVEELHAKLNRLGFPVVRDQFMCPNIDATVVAELQQRGFIHAAHLCGCLYLQRYQSLIRDRYGGIALLFADVWGGFDAGAYRVLELSVNLRLLEPSAGTFVTFAACARGDRGRKRDADEATDDVSTFQAVERKGMELLRGYAGGHGDAVSVPPSAGVPLRYGPGKLMHVHAWRWQPRR